MIQNMFRKDEIFIHTPKVQFISVFDNLSQFVHPPIDEFEQKYAQLLKQKHKRPLSGPAVVNEQQFFYQFDIFTDGIFRGFSGWENMLIVGGAVLGFPITFSCLYIASLLPMPTQIKSQKDVIHYYYKNYANSDIDIYFWGLNAKQFTQKLLALYDHFYSVSDGRLFIVRTFHTLTFVFPYPKRRVQLIMGIWHRKEDILINCDIDCS